MKAAEVLDAARAAGVTVKLQGRNLLLEASAAPPEAVVAMLRQNKAAIMDLLRPSDDGWTACRWRAYYAERMRSLMETCGLAHRDASSRAHACCVIEWINRRPKSSPSGVCAWCGFTGSYRGTVVPFGVLPGRHTWLHSACWPNWHQETLRMAEEALAAMGIPSDGVAS